MLGAGTRPGSGQTVGVIDSGIDQQRPAFSGKSVHEVFWDGTFGRTQADSLFAGIEGAAHLGAWRVSAGAEIGRATPSAHGGMIVGVSSLRTSAFAIRVLRNLDDRTSVTLSLAQPLRIESGHARFSVPVDLGQDGRLRTGT